MFCFVFSQSRFFWLDFLQTNIKSNCSYKNCQIELNNSCQISQFLTVNCCAFQSDKTIPINKLQESPAAVRRSIFPGLNHGLLKNLQFCLMCFPHTYVYINIRKYTYRYKIYIYIYIYICIVLYVLYYTIYIYILYYIYISISIILYIILNYVYTCMIMHVEMLVFGCWGDTHLRGRADRELGAENWVLLHGILIAGLEHLDHFPWYMGCHPSHWRSYFSD